MQCCVGRVVDCRVVIVNDVQLLAGKMMEQGPVLVISFTAQEINVIHDVTGRVVDGDPVCSFTYLISSVLIISAAYLLHVSVSLSVCLSVCLLIV